MHCPKCGNQNPDDAQVCSSCSSELPKAPMGTDKLIPRMSGLAIAAFVLGILSLFTCGLTAVPAIVLGIIGFVLIERSGGRLTGRSFAVIGVVMPGFVFFVLMLPALRRTRSIIFNEECRKNLSGIGKAMVIYANDYDGEFPRSGAKDSIWAGHILNWRAENRFNAYGLNSDGSGGRGNISSCFYLLVKYVEVTPKSFLCRGDVGVTEFNPADDAVGNIDLADLWDFGMEPDTHCSYSYHMPFGLYALTTSSEPGMAVAADRNPWQDSPSATAKQYPGTFNPDGGKEAVRYGNTIAHQEDGQNVLFVDGHVSFMTHPFLTSTPF